MDTIQKEISSVLSRNKRRKPYTSSDKIQNRKKKTEKEFLLMYTASLDEFYSLEEEKADYIDGTIAINSPASIKHEKIFVELITKLNQIVSEKSLGSVLGSRALVVLAPEYRFEPDIVFVSNQNSGEFKEFEFVGSPDLVIEILSKSTKAYDLDIKRSVYQRFRVKEIIFIDQENGDKTIDILAPDGNYSSHKIGGEEAYLCRTVEGVSI